MAMIHIRTKNILKSDIRIIETMFGGKPLYLFGTNRKTDLHTPKVFHSKFIAYFFVSKK